MSILATKYDGRARCATRRSGARRRPPPDGAALRLRRARRRRRPPRPDRALPGPAPSDERDLALRRLGESRRDARPPVRARPPRTASSARGRPRPAAPASPSASERERRRQPLRRLERDHRMRPARKLVPQRRERPLAARQEADELVPLRREARWQRAPSRPPTAPGSTVTGTPARAPPRRAARPGSLIAGHARVGDERDALARLQPRQQLRGPLRLVVLVVGEQRAPRSRAGPATRACGACPRRARRRRRGARSSTRSVTSSRFPIGVAQTASGISYAEGVERRRGRRRSAPRRCRALPARSRTLAARRQRLARARSPAPDRG